MKWSRGRTRYASVRGEILRAILRGGYEPTRLDEATEVNFMQREFGHWFLTRRRRRYHGHNG